MQDARFNRLPKWAQDEITFRRRDEAHWRDELAKGVLGEAHSADSLHLPDARDNKGAYMPSRFRDAQFMVGGRWNDFIHFRMETPDTDGVRRVYVHSGTSALVVEPRASNALLLRIVL